MDSVLGDAGDPGALCRKHFLCPRCLKNVTARFNLESFL